MQRESEVVVKRRKCPRLNLARKVYMTDEHPHGVVYVWANSKKEAQRMVPKYAKQLSYRGTLGQIAEEVGDERLGPIWKNWCKGHVLMPRL